MHIRAQNAALIVRRLSSDDFVQFEVFEVSPQNVAITTTEGKLLCSYPGPAIQVPVDIFKDRCFLRELSSFLVQMDVDCLDSTPTASKAGSIVLEVRESAHPKYISELLVGILRGYGQPAVVDRITKRIGDEILWDNAYKPWQRSPLWLTLRVTLQSSLRAGYLYKSFMLFFHTHLLRRSVRQNFPSELLYVMRVKIARRLSKLSPAMSHNVYEFVQETFRATEALLSKRWTAFQSKGLSRLTLQHEKPDFVADAKISLQNSYNYLSKMLCPVSHGSSKMGFTPSNGTRLNTLRDFSQFTNGRLANAIDRNQHIALNDFETTVEKSLKSWIAASRGNNDAPDVIASCIQQYFAGANRLYEENPEDSSMMILTIMDLWVALDTFTIQQCPLLEQYPPEIPSDFLQPLLLHRSSSLLRALRIEEYLCRRHDESCNSTSIFSNNVGTSFAVKYFRDSKDLQRLHNEIIADAEEKQAKKRAELDHLNETSRALLQSASQKNHEMSVDDFGNEVHSKKCCKCRFVQQAKSLKICVYEWPLPRSAVLAQQTVFELSPPNAFTAWRGITYLILRDIGLSSVPDSLDKPKALLDSFSGLSRWAAPRPKDYRVTIGSTTKSFSDQTHYKEIRIPADMSFVFVNNGLSYKLFDRIRESWTIDSFSASDVSGLCTPRIPSSGPYKPLHRFVCGTQHTPNDTIAAQADCPTEISLHEFLAFSGLRSGSRLQWLNIARELASTYLSFRREEVHTLVTQAAWQLGPLLDGVREWHIDLNVPSFGDTLICELESLLEKIRANWLEEVTVRTIGT